MGGAAQGDQEILQSYMKDLYVINFIKLSGPQSSTFLTREAQNRPLGKG